MPPKPPIRGTTTVSVHRPRPDDSIPRLRFPPPSESGPPPSPSTRPTSITAPTAIDVELHRIISLPPPVSVRAIVASWPSPVAHQRQLQDYWIHSLPALPAADARGISTYRGRQYVKVPEGGTVQVGLDSASGLYRAKWPSELHPSGPLLQFDADGGLWQPVDTSSPLTYPLSARRLEAFRADLDFSTAVPDSDGLYRFNGKLYALIEQHAYQVLHDLDASTPRRKVMRIVRAEDPVATQENNIYLASRLGSSEPVAFDARHGWQGTIVYGAAGMPRTVADSMTAFLQRLDAGSEIDRINAQIREARKKRQELFSAWVTAKDGAGEHAARVSAELTALVQRELHSHRELKQLGKALKFYEDEKSVIKTFMTEGDYRDAVIALQKSQMLAYQQLIECGMSRRALEGPLLDFTPERLARTVGFLARQLAHLKKRQLIADTLLKKWKVSADDLGQDVLSPMDTHDVVASWVLSKSVLLDNPQSRSDAPQASDLAVQFGQATFVYGALDSVPQAAHPVVLNNLAQQCAAIRDWYDRLDLPDGPEHVTSRNDISAEISAFEHMLETRLNRIYHAQPDGTAPPVHELPIDFDFIPPQVKNGPPPKSWRLFRAKKHGVYKLHVGESRRTAQGEEVIGVTNTFDLKQSAQIYERRDGEWRPTQAVQSKRLPTLIAEARLHLQQTDSYVDIALRQEQAKNHPDNIVETLEGRAKTLDDTALELQRFETSDANATPLVQSLREQSQRLRETGEEIRIRIYKDKDFLSVDRLIYLMDRAQVRVVKTDDRIKRGKGKNREYLDLYSIRDATGDKELWHAHFHYPARNTPDLNFNVRGAHLKTLQQSAMGAAAQRREERAGREHVAIWREHFDGRTAQRIFNLAASTPPLASPGPSTITRQVASLSIHGYSPTSPRQ